MKTSFYDRIMPEDECIAITRNYEQSIVVENVTFNSKTTHKFSAFLVFEHMASGRYEPLGAADSYTSKTRYSFLILLVILTLARRLTFARCLLPLIY